MSDAREAIASVLWWSVPSEDTAAAQAGAERMLDAYRAEVLHEVAVAVRAAAPKYLDNDVDLHVFHVLDALANKIAAGDLS